MASGLKAIDLSSVFIIHLLKYNPISELYGSFLFKQVHAAIASTQSVDTLFESYNFLCENIYCII